MSVSLGVWCWISSTQDEYQHVRWHRIGCADWRGKWKHHIRRSVSSSGQNWPVGYRTSQCWLWWIETSDSLLTWTGDSTSHLNWLFSGRPASKGNHEMNIAFTSDLRFVISVETADFTAECPSITDSNTMDSTNLSRWGSIRQIIYMKGGIEKKYAK